jgi:hypothetical protein
LFRLTKFGNADTFNVVGPETHRTQDIVAAGLQRSISLIDELLRLLNPLNFSG